VERCSELEDFKRVFSTRGLLFVMSGASMLFFVAGMAKGMPDLVMLGIGLIILISGLMAGSVFGHK